MYCDGNDYIVSVSILTCTSVSLGNNSCFVASCTPHQDGVWRAKCNKIGMKIRHTYVSIYGHAECAYTDLRLHIRTYS